MAEPSPFDRGGSAPGRWDGTGWVQDGDDWIYKQGDGRYWSNNRQEWAIRPDLLSGLPASPGPVPVAVKAQAEVARLRTPWPTYGDAWRSAKTEKWLCRRYLVHLLWVAPLVVLAEYVFGAAIRGPETSPGYHEMTSLGKWLVTINIVALVLIPCALWRVYHRALKAHDPHKAAAFTVATYGVVAGTAHAARRHGERHPSAPINPPGWTPEKGFDNQRLNRVMREQ